MTEAPIIQDETLRLILSADQARWLRDQIDDTKRMIRLAFAISFFCSLWVFAEFSGVLARFDPPACYQFTMQTSNEAERAKHRQRIADAGHTLCEDGKGPEQSLWKSIHGPLSILFAFIAFLSALSLVRQLFMYRKFRSYEKDNAAFLKKYGRDPNPR